MSLKRGRNLIAGENGLLFGEPNLIVAKLMVNICWFTLLCTDCLECVGSINMLHELVYK